MSYSMSTDQRAGVTEAPAGGDGQGRNQWAFHVVAVLVFAGATAAAGLAALLVLFGTSVCNERDTSDELIQLRLWFAIIGVLWTALPAGFAVAAAKFRFVWVPWAVLAGIAGLVSLSAVPTAEVSTFCLF